MKPNTHRQLWLTLFLVMLISMQACHFGDYSIRLPGGYSLVRVYGGAVIISDPQHSVVVNANIDSYKVIDGQVVGHVSTEEYFSPEEKVACKPGYFILNTKTHELKQGLDKKAWLDSLQAMGVHGEPHLGKPSPSDKNY